MPYFIAPGPLGTSKVSLESGISFGRRQVSSNYGVGSLVKIAPLLKTDAAVSCKRDEYLSMGLFSAAEMQLHISEGEPLERLPTLGVEQDAGRFCPDISNREFFDLMLGYRHKAVRVISNARLAELARWAASDRERVEEWFGTGSASEQTRRWLVTGLTSAVRVLRGLTSENFLLLSEVNSVPGRCFREGVDVRTIDAEVCPSDVSHTIGFTRKFCSMRDFASEADSKFSALIHEVLHFNDVFASKDLRYGLKNSRSLALFDPALAKRNTDSICGYIVWGVAFNA